jgi:hypothetical protein
VPASLSLFDSAQRYFFSGSELNVIDVHVEFAAPTHPSLRFHLGHGSPRYTASRHHNNIVNLDLFQDLEIHRVIYMRVRG